MNDRIKLEDTAIEAIIKIVEGNPGAATVCTQFIKEGGIVDPDSALGGMSNLFSLDTNKIYGAKIWMLYKDVCGEDIVNAIAVLRGHQLGIVSSHQLHHAIDNYGDGLDVGNTLNEVKKQLPNFGKNINGG